MGTKHKKDVIEHRKTQLVIKQCSTCKDCPLKIYAKENEKITYGVGNIHSNVIIVLPTYDTNADKDYNTILKLLLDTYKEHTGRDLLEDAYITRLVKCYKNSPYNLIDAAIPYCSFHISYEMLKINAKNIIFTSDTLKQFIDGFHSRNNIRTFGKNTYTMYSPAIMYYNNETIKSNFIEQLKWIAKVV